MAVQGDQGEKKNNTKKINEKFWKLENDLGLTPVDQQTAQDRGEQLHVATSRRPTKEEHKTKQTKQSLNRVRETIKTMIAVSKCDKQERVVKGRRTEEGRKEVTYRSSSDEVREKQIRSCLYQRATKERKQVARRRLWQVDGVMDDEG